MTRYFCGNKLKLWRKKRSLSIAGLAQKVGVHWRMVCYYESGKYQPSFGVLRGLANALQVPVDSLTEVKVELPA